MDDISNLVKRTEPAPLHGRVRFWQAQAKKAHGNIGVEFERKRDGLSFRPARFLVHVYAEHGEELACDPEPWDEQVNDDLVRIGARAINPANESERLGYALKFKLEHAEVRYGDGYFNSMLNYQLRRLGFEAYPVVKRCLDRIASGTPSRDSVAFDDCKRDIVATLAEVGGQLTGDLGYASEDAQEVLANSVAYYLDERFHVTNRERLGWR